MIELRLTPQGVPLDVLDIELTGASGQDLRAHVLRDGPLFRLSPWVGDAILSIHTGDLFPSNTQVACVLRIQTGQGPDNQVVLPKVDVSALPAVELIRFVDESPQSWTISAIDVRPAAVAPVRQPDDNGPPRVMADPIGDAARDAARRRLGRTHALEADARDMHVIVDVSASMLPLFRSGAIQGVLNLLGGINDVHGRSEEFTVWPASSLTAPTPVRVTRSSVHGLAALLIAAPGVTSSSGVAHGLQMASDPDAWRVIVSDGIPPDLLDTVSVHGVGHPPHLLAFAESAAFGVGPAFEPWRDQLGATRQAVATQRLNVTAIDPRSPQALFAPGQSQVVDQIVGGLVEPLTAKDAA